MMPVSTTVQLGRDVVIHHPDLVNLYGCTIGDETKVGAFVEVQKNAHTAKPNEIKQSSAGKKKGKRRR